MVYAELLEKCNGVWGVTGDMQWCVGRDWRHAMVMMQAVGGLFGVAAIL